MNTIKKLWQYQKLLLSSLQFGIVGPFSSPDNNPRCLSILLMVFVIGFCSYAFGSMNAISIIMLSIVFSYGIPTSKRKPYALVPVSKKYALFNLYLLPLVISAIMYAFMYAAMVVIALILWAVVLISKTPQDAVAMISYQAGIKTGLFFLMFVLIAILLSTAISVIRRKKIRWIAMGIFIGISSGLMVWLKSVLPSISSESATFFVTLGFENMLPGFEQLPNVWIILLCMAAALLIITPVSIRFTYRKYMSDVSKKND